MMAPQKENTANNNSIIANKDEKFLAKDHQDGKSNSFIESYNNQVYYQDSMQSDDDDDDDSDSDDFDDDDTTSHNSSSGPNNNNNKNNKSNNKKLNEIEELAKKENAHVQAWRLIVLLCILIVGALVCTGTYIFLINQERNDEKDSYKLFAKTAADSAKSQFEQLLRAMESMAESITATSIASNAKFPFVTVPLFEIVAGQTRDIGGIEMFAFIPFVTQNQRNTWNNYAQKQQKWLNESKSIVLANKDHELLSSYDNRPIPSDIWVTNIDGNVTYSPEPGPYAPIWQCSPPPFSSAFINFDMMTEGYVNRMVPVLIQTRDGLMSEINPTLSRMAGIAVSQDDHDKYHLQYLNTRESEINTYTHPHSVHLQPIFETHDNEQASLVGFIAAVIPWDRFVAHLLPDGVMGIMVVVTNNCGQSFTYVLHGSKAEFIGDGDLHHPDSDDSEIVVPTNVYKYGDQTRSKGGHCVYEFHFYSTNDYHANKDDSNLPVIITVALSVLFIVMAITFLMYDRFVARRNNKVVDAATRSNDIISSLFPTQVRDRLFADKEENNANDKDKQGTKSRLKNMLNDGLMDINKDEDDDITYKSKPIADLFPETTILFADIAGFTAWSSVREPSQVFILLETLYRAFDDIAKKRRVFKVETVGDCYVAVTGLPDPRKDHAVAMSRFARDILFKMRTLSKKLEVTLGPDTGDLAMRIGIHSGPVTAGVLRGERSRFQLFGDTMNTAARMEHTGKANKIQMSQETADLLIAAGKTNWVSQREDVVHAKGKGEMQTYWLELSTRNDSSSVVDSTSSNGSEVESENPYATHSENVASMYDAKTIRLIEWNVDVLLRLLKQIVARRRASPIPPSERLPPIESRFTDTHGSTLDEVKEIITLPKYRDVHNHEDPENISLDPLVVQQLHDYVVNVAAIYRDNPFHNFEHASHVTMSVVKLLSRIVAPQDELEVDELGHHKTLHDHTYGITSDPLTQFACVFSALIHDIDHTGVPNAQLVKEGTEVAHKYKNKSVAEQNSVDLAWNLLMDDDFKNLRNAIYETDPELKRFRQLVVNSVMATDIVDKELKTLRNLRWDRAFSESTQDVDGQDTINRKATIVIEHLIQASDVAHTMQHWHIYRKWNERFFVECYQAYLDGRAENDPSEGWYKGEIGFFDFYIIPLAKKLKDCGVFGVSSDEYLNYAMKNRQEWEARGKSVVDEMIESVNKKNGSTATPHVPIKNPQSHEDSARPA